MWNCLIILDKAAWRPAVGTWPNSSLSGSPQRVRASRCFRNQKLECIWVVPFEQCTVNTTFSLTINTAVSWPGFILFFYPMLASIILGLGFTLKDLESVPFGVALPIREAIYRCREQPCPDWSEDVCLLIGRQDLTKQAHKMMLAKSKTVSETSTLFPSC